MVQTSAAVDQPKDKDMRRISFIVVAGLVAIGGVRSVTRVSLLSGSSESAEVTRIPNRFVCDLPGVEVRDVRDAAAVRLADQDGVIGIVVNGQARSYLKSGMDQPATHIAYDSIDGVHVAVAFCELTDDARVFCGDPDAMRSVRVGGWDGDKMEIIVAEERFRFDSPAIGLEEIPLRSMSWSGWRTLHPRTKIFLGSAAADHEDPDRQLDSGLRR